MTVRQVADLRGLPDAPASSAEKSGPLIAPEVEADAMERDDPVDTLTETPGGGAREDYPDEGVFEDEPGPVCRGGPTREKIPEQQED